MEDALVPHDIGQVNTHLGSLNPCFNGRCTRTISLREAACFLFVVLILVLMEDALVPFFGKETSSEIVQS